MRTRSFFPLGAWALAAVLAFGMAWAAEAQDAPPPPPGDGCADAEQWVANILNPPPPDPDAKPVPPRPPLTLADLPGQCASVLRAQ